MGNYLSCKSFCTCNCASSPRSSVKKGRPSRSESMLIKVVHSVERRVLELGGAPMKVAELMLEFPGHFVAELEKVCQADGAQLAGCKRAAPLAADDETKPGRVYILLPMHRLHTRVAALESASFAQLLNTTATPAPATKAAKPQKHGLTSSKVTPLNTNCVQDSLSQLSEDHPAINTEENGSIHGASQHLNCSPLLQGEPQLLQQEDDAVALSHHQRHVMIMRSKTWVPKLETISESLPLTV